MAGNRDVRAQSERQVAFGLRGSRRDDPPRTEVPGELHRERPDATGRRVDDHRLTHAHPGAALQDMPRRQSLYEQSERLGIPHRIGHLHGIGGVHDGPFREAPATEDRRQHPAAVTAPPDHLGAGHERQLRHRAVRPRDPAGIREIHPGGAHRDEQLPVGRHRLGDLGEFQHLGSAETGALHSFHHHSALVDHLERAAGAGQAREKVQRPAGE
jgi:hypothetical protein